MTQPQKPYDEWIQELKKVSVKSPEWSRLSTSIATRALEELRKRDRALEIAKKEFKNMAEDYCSACECVDTFNEAARNTLQQIEEVLK